MVIIVVWIGHWGYGSQCCIDRCDIGWATVIYLNHSSMMGELWYEWATVAPLCHWSKGWVKLVQVSHIGIGGLWYVW